MTASNRVLTHAYIAHISSLIHSLSLHFHFLSLCLYSGFGFGTVISRSLTHTLSLSIFPLARAFVSRWTDPALSLAFGPALLFHLNPIQSTVAFLFVIWPTLSAVAVILAFPHSAVSRLPSAGTSSGGSISKSYYLLAWPGPVNDHHSQSNTHVQQRERRETERKKGALLLLPSRRGRILFAGWVCPY